MAKTTEKTLERTYNVPLRKEYMKAPRWNRTKKAVTALRQFLVKHMKSENVLLSKELNEEMWKHGIKNPPHHVKVKATKDDKGVVKAELLAELSEKTKTKLYAAGKAVFFTADKKISSPFFKNAFKVIDSCAQDEHEIIATLHQHQAGKIRHAAQCQRCSVLFHRGSMGTERAALRLRDSREG